MEVIRGVFLAVGNAYQLHSLFSMMLLFVLLLVSAFVHVALV